ncbi:MAG: C10 family peptidase, partial [Treponema sp.]|nr:C10 family peptidase [Treponema sp.]
MQVSFTAPAAGAYNFESSNNGTLDPVAYSSATSSSSSNTIDDDSGQGYNFRFLRHLNAGEIFTFFAGVVGNAGTGSYTVSVNTSTIPSVSLAANVPATVTINGGQRVLLSFTAPAAGTYIFESTNNGTLDPVAFSAVIGTRNINDNGGQNRNYRFTRNLSAGEHVTFFSGLIRDRGDGSYMVSVRDSGAAAVTQQTASSGTAQPADESDSPIIPGDDELESLLREPLNPQAVVRPLIQTKWNQGPPYNNLFPHFPNDRRAAANGRIVTNCTNTAWAQIMAFHRHPVRGRGQSAMIGPGFAADISRVPSENLNVAYDWDNMINSYRSDGVNSNERQRNAVATLMYHKALAAGAQRNQFLVLTDNFDYDRSIQTHERVYYNDADWEALIRSQLDAGLPVYYSADRQGGGHAFIVDGYDSARRFHVNWGWGGSRDGWYYLNELVPSPDRNYNRDHSVIINIRPNRGSTGSHEMGLRNFTANKAGVLTAQLSVQQNELFTVTANVTSFGFFTGGQVGVALVNASGAVTAQSLIAVIGTENQESRRPGESLSASSSGQTINCFIPDTVRPGQYRLVTVTRQTGGEWKIVTISPVNISNAIPVTVTAGLANSGGYGQALSAFRVSQTTVSQNELLTVTPSFRNVGTEFSGGQFGLALVDNNNVIVEVIGIADREGYLGTIRGFVPETVRPGQYRLMAVVRPEGGQWRIATLALPNVPNSFDLTVTAESVTPGGGYGLALEDFSVGRTTS